MDKELNHLIMYGVVKKKTRKGFIINFGYGNIRLVCPNRSILDGIKVGYTISISGLLRKKMLSFYVVSSNIVIFDTKPHTIPTSK